MGKNVKIERFLKIPIGPIVKIVNSLDDLEKRVVNIFVNVKMIYIVVKYLSSNFVKIYKVEKNKIRHRLFFRRNKSHCI